MNSMTKRLVLGLVVGAVAAMSAMADQIKIEPNFGPYRSGHGGEFTALPIGFTVGGYVSGVTSDLVEPGTFQTFCLEVHENINPATYDVAHNTKTVFSNVTLNKGTAYLYDQFAAGTLGSYNYG